jgi:hypothetical protein
MRSLLKICIQKSVDKVQKEPEKQEQVPGKNNWTVPENPANTPYTLPFFVQVVQVDNRPASERAGLFILLKRGDQRC